MIKKILFIFLILFIVGCTSENYEYKELYIDDEIVSNVAISNSGEIYVEQAFLEKLSLTNFDTSEYKTKGDVKYFSLKTNLKESAYAFEVSGEKVNVFLNSKSLVHFTEALEIFEEGSIANVVDLETGKEFQVRRVVGSYVATIADVEPLTIEDTEIFKELAGGWNHRRRAISLEVNGQFLAASIAAFPHSGREDMPFGEVVDNRSGNTGSGINLNSIRDNGMNGVVDIYFYNSLTPGLNRVDAMHQSKILAAAALIRG